MRRWLQDAVDLEAQGYEANALDIIYSTLYDLALEGKFSEIDIVLAETEPKDLPATIQLGILTVTFWFQDSVPNRKVFRRKVFELFADVPDRDEVLKNL